jgi:hypothetical protein
MAMTSFPRTGLCAALLLSAVLVALPDVSRAQPSDPAAPALPQTMPAPPPNPEDPAPDKEATEQPASESADQKQELPTTPPKPQANPEEPSSEPTPAPEPKPKPAPADIPGEPRTVDQPEEEPQALPVAPPEPDKRPADAPGHDKPNDTAKKEENPPAQKRVGGPRPQQGPPLPNSLVGPEPAAELACRAELKTLGVEFKDRGPQSNENGCSMPYPVSISNFGSGIKVEPPVVANCAVSLAMAKFLQGPVKDAARKHLKADITAMANGSGYVCRPRHRTQKLSEHALGNAIDIMSFTLSDDRSVVVEKTTDKAETDFLAEVSKAACGPFTTVLGPGSDADHADHFHLDLADRRPGVTFCQ